MKKGGQHLLPSSWKYQSRTLYSKMLAWGLIFALTIPLFSTAFVSAADPADPSLCPHHKAHTEECGYAPPAAGLPCSHVHDDTCGYAEPVEEIPCGHVHNSECGWVEAVEETPCGHIHDGSCGWAEAAEEIPCDLDCSEVDADGAVIHAEGCAYTPANPGVPCGHVHDASCGYSAPVEGAPCGHVHDEECGYRAPAAGTPCGHQHDQDCGYQAPQPGTPCAYQCELCVTDWQWQDEEGYLLWNDSAALWGVGLPGASEEAPLTRDGLESLLPQAVTAQTAAGSRDVKLVWYYDSFPESAFSGSYTLTADLEGDYVLTQTAPKLEVLVEPGGAEMYAAPFNVALNEWTWEGFDTGAETVLIIDKDSIHTTDDLITKLNAVLPKRIYGWTTGANKTYDDGAFTYANKQEIIDVGGKPTTCSWGYLNVDWSTLSNQINNTTNWNSDFTVTAPLPSYPERKYFVNDGNDTGSRTELPITIHPISLTDHTVTPASPENVTVNLFDYWVEDYGENPTETKVGTNEGGDTLQKSDQHCRPASIDNPDENSLSTPVKFSNSQDWNNGINQDHLLLFGDGLIHAGLWNKGAGAGTLYGNKYAGMEGIVNKTLTDGYPVINTGDAKKQLTESRDYTLVRDYKLAGDHYGTENNTQYEGIDIQNLSNTVIGTWGGNIDTDTESLQYLFDPSVSNGYKKSYENVTGLFQLDSQGYYYYDMRQNFAEFQENHTSKSDGKFILYDAPATTRTDRSENPASYGNFFPFNKGSEVFNGLDENGNLTSSVYCANNAMNHHLGMTVSVDFRQPANGTINTGANSQPMTFQFSGDDDVWVFIDDVLVLDMGGIHSELYGIIDFASGNVLIGRGFNTLGIPDYDPNYPEATQDLVTQTNLKALYEAAGKVNSTQWSNNTFASNSEHTLKMFYLERGNYDSSLALRFNLQPLLYQRIQKVDQDGEPISGVKFELYPAVETSQTDTDAIPCLYTDSDVAGNQPFYVKQDTSRGSDSLVTLTTDENGTATFKTSDGHLFNFADRGSRYYILREKSAPAGYRKQPVDIVLYYDASTAMLSVANRWSTGAYACSVSNITGPPISGTNSSEETGLVVAVPLLQKKSDGNAWLALFGSNLSGFYSVSASSKEDDAAILKAALEQAKRNAADWHLDWDAGNNRLTGMLSDLPGLASRYQLVNANGDMHMAYGLISPEALRALGVSGNTAAERYEALRKVLNNEATVDTTISEAENDSKLEAAVNSAFTTISEAKDGFKLLDINTFNRTFRSLIYIPNERRELWVQKIDQDGKPLPGAEFGLYTDAKCETTPAAHGTTDGNGLLIFSPKDDSDPGHAKMVWANSDNTHYYLKEITPPAGYGRNETVTPVVVGTYSIYADAGKEGNGVSVMAGVGRLTQTMRQYAMESDVDITLQDITAFMQTQESGSFTLSGWEDAKLEGTAVTRSMNLHFGQNAVVDYGLHNEDGGGLYKPFFITDTGFIRARVEQNNDTTRYETKPSDTNKDALGSTDLTNLFSLLNVVVVTDQNDNSNPQPGTGKLTISKTVTGSNLTDADYTKLFSFQVNLTDADGSQLDGKYQYYFYGEDKAGSISNGDTLFLHHNESVTILGLPVGTRYEVTEKEESGWHISPEKTQSGEISKDTAAIASFANSKDPNTPPSEPDEPNNPPTDPTPPTDPPTDPENPPPGSEDPESPPTDPENPPDQPPDIPNLPNPNDPNSPETVTIIEEGVPKTYVKVWDPEEEEWVYIPEEDVPLWYKEIPETGDTGHPGLWKLLSGLAILGLVALQHLKKKDSK